MADHQRRKPLTSGGRADINFIDIDIDIDQVMVIPHTPARISKQSNNICKISSSGDFNMRNSVRDNRVIRERRNRLVADNVHAAGLYTHPGGDAARVQASNSSVPLSSSRDVQVSNKIAGKTVMHKDGHHCYNLVMVDDIIPYSNFGEKLSHHHRSENPVLVEKGDNSKCSPKFKKHDLGARKIDEVYMLSSNVIPSHKGKVKVGHDDRVRCNALSVKGNDNTCLISSDNNCAPSLSRNDNEGKVKVMVHRDEPVHSNAICVKGNDNAFPIASDYGTEKGPSVPSQSRKRLVRNGCISPHNIAKAKRIVMISGDSEKAACCAASGGSHPIIDVSEVTSKNNAGIQAKGKGILVHDSSSNCHASRRNDAGHSTNKCHKAKFPEDCIIPQDTRDTSNKDGTSRNTTAFSSRSFEDKVIIRDHQLHSARPSLRKSKKSSDNSEKSTKVISLSSVGESSTVKSLRDHAGIPEGDLGSSSVVDELSPEVRESISQTDNDSEARKNQLEADEMLARELQEQLYNETPFFANRESVSSLGSRMAEQQEDGQQAAFPIHHGNNAVFPSLQTQPLQQSLRARLFSRRHRTRHSRPNLSRIRNRSYRSPMAIRNQHYPSMNRHHLFASHMDFDMRMHLLESWEAMYLGDVGVADQFNIDREFGENDYEMLLALDENNHAHLGASVAQIANLPESTVNNDNCETCSICLETPVVGDTMRHLPCLHKFHKDCIDLWLRRKRSCPVCKSDILL